MIHKLFHIWSWVMQPEVWRFVGFASAVVGLLCYVLSSSFNYLFGSRNLWKIILYTVFSFIICSAILFAKIWQRSRSLEFKAHIAFLVLTVTSLYSFYYDKVVKGNPDAYSLTSCGSFAIMSLSLSRKKTQCGFEIDLLYFFLGCLLVQLMKIKLLLFFVGVCFSYLLIILRTCFSSMDASLDNEFPNSLQDENNHVAVEAHSDSPQQTQVMYEAISDLQKKIWSWVMQPEVWRFVGLASAVVGLLCCALSSSFNYCFGSWNLLKIILYTVFSFIICSALLFAMIWQQSRTLWFRTHTVFLLLIITSLYSFYFDKVVKEKPEAYSLISCVSFVIMSLSLSREKTLNGLEIDLQYYFLGCLCVQLMKIKLLLFFVGVCFSCMLIVLRTCFSSTDASLDNELPNSLQDENNPVVVEVHSDSPQQEKGIQEQNNKLLKRSSHITHDKASSSHITHDKASITKMKLVLKLDIHDDKIKQKAMKAATSLSGVDSISVDMRDKKLTLIGNIDPAKAVAKLRNFGPAEIVSVGPVKEEKEV